MTRQLTPGDIHLWWVNLDLPAPTVERLAAVLSADEIARAGRYRFEADRRRFIGGRATLRHILAGYLGAAAASFRFETGVHGKPSLHPSTGGETYTFNTSHAGALALHAIAPGPSVGVDIERVRFLPDCDSVAAAVLSERERAAWRCVPASLSQHTFFRSWACKEAILKAQSAGLARPPESVELSVSPGEPARLLAIDGESGEAGRWLLRELPAPPGYVAALAVEAGP